MYWLIGKIAIFISCKVLFRVKYENEKILDQYEKCLICPNHSRIFDPVFLYPKVDNMYTVAKSELFKTKFKKKLFSYYQAIPIKRDKSDITGVKQIVEVLRNKEKIRLVIFPEGRVVKNKKERGKIKNGAVHIAASEEIPIIPVYITARPKFFSKVTVQFGVPVYLKREIINSKEEIKEKSRELLEKIYSYEKEEK